MDKQRQLILELIWLFLFTPALLSLPVFWAIKTIAVLAALGYVGWRAKQLGLFNRLILLKFNQEQFVGNVLKRFLVFVLFSSLLVYLWVPESLFKVVLNNPLLWVGICLFYSIFSVYPQEFVYRTFFFSRYRSLIGHPFLFILANAVIFSFAHIIFSNALVFALTFAGGLIFAYSYQKFDSLMLTSIEHACYGCWLFTLGIGDMLAFPGP